jgi:hypothetical protein
VGHKICVLDAQRTHHLDDVTRLRPFIVSTVGMGREAHAAQVRNHDGVILDAKLAGLKAGLKLTPDHETLWGPFEAAVHAAAAMRVEHMEEMMARMHDMRAGDDMDRKVANSAKPCRRSSVWTGWRTD